MMSNSTAPTAIPAALSALRDRRMVVLLDDHSSGEGDVVQAAEHVTPDAINFMATHARGLTSIAMTPARLDELNLPLVVPEDENTSRHQTPFCIPIDAIEGATTGISAADRALTVRLAIDPKTKPEELSRPGHVYPLRAAAGGVIEHAGRAEAVVDLLRFAGLYPAGVVCEIMNEDGSMATGADVRRFAEKHRLPVITLSEVVAFARQATQS
jgi:3,4-dihydroxy-2-butanone 4-phosphate synthase